MESTTTPPTTAPTYAAPSPKSPTTIMPEDAAAPAPAPAPLLLTLGAAKSSPVPTEQGWKITLNNADGTSSEMVLEPLVPEDDGLAKEEAEKAPPAPPSRLLRFYLIVQYILNTMLAISIIGFMAFTLVKYNSSKNVPGAWPANPVLSPTFLMMIVSIINLSIDAVNLLVQCCGQRAITSVGKVVKTVHSLTSVVATVGPAIAAGISKYGFNFSGSNDLWGWTCNNAADAFQSVNSSQTVCNSNSVAWGLQVAQIFFQVLSVAVPFFSKWRMSQENSKSASAGAKDEKPKAKGGDEEAVTLIADWKTASATIAPAS